jgi:hypothetical protein
MLAAMSSLASLAHGARAAAPAFNGLFYATAATIIPVLFLAIAVQGPLYGDLLKASDAALRRFREHKAGPARRAWSCACGSAASLHPVPRWQF